LISDLEGWVALKKLDQIPIAGGEMFAEAGQFRHYIDAGAFDVVQPDAAVLSGPNALLQVGEYAEHSHTPMIMHGWAGPVAQMQNIHGALASPSCDMVEYCTLFNPLLEETLAPLWKFENGRLQAPTLPGMGVKITTETEKQYPFQDSVGNLIA
jgi:L-alanine-DL-glutamate epimerase-like enolase superfamily enzyme